MLPVIEPPAPTRHDNDSDHPLKTNPARIRYRNLPESASKKLTYELGSRFCAIKKYGLCTCILAKGFYHRFS